MAPQDQPPPEPDTGAPEPAHPDAPDVPDVPETAPLEVLPPGEVVAAPRFDLSAADQAAVDALLAGTAMLVVHRGPGSGQRFLLDAETTTAGRDPGCDIFLDDVTVSRAHASFVRQGGRHVVRDTRSLNGTYVNRLRVHEAVLSAGDQVQIGKYHLVFHPGPHDALAEPATS